MINSIITPLSRINRKSIYFFKLGLALSVFFILMKKISLTQIKLAFAESDLVLIGLVFVLLFLNIAIQFQKWRLLVTSQARVSNQDIFNSLLAGYTLGFITPGRLGEYGRGIFIRDLHWSHWAGLTLIDKFFSIGIVYTLGALGVAYFIHDSVSSNLYLIFFMIPILFVIIFYLATSRPQLLTNHFKKHFERYPRLFSAAKLLNNLSSKLLVQVLALSILHVFTFLLQLTLLIKSFSSLAMLKGFIAASAIMATKSLIPIAIGDLGIRESLSIFYLSKFNIVQAAAFNASLLLFFINIMIPSLLGMIIILKKKKSDQDSISL